MKIISCRHAASKSLYHKEGNRIFFASQNSLYVYVSMYSSPLISDKKWRGSMSFSMPKYFEGVKAYFTTLMPSSYIKVFGKVQRSFAHD